MLKKLRKRFIANNMFLVGTIIISVFAALFFVSYTYERQQSLDALMFVLERSNETNLLMGDGIFDENEFAAGTKEENNKVRNVIMIVQTDSTGNVVSFSTAANVSVTQKALTKLISLSLSSEESDGVIKGYTLRYLRLPNEFGGYNIGFADTSAETQTLGFMLRICIFCSLFILSIMFLISDYMAHKAIAPIEKSWNNQNRFVADASHELKTPLTVILANMDIMLSSPDSTVKEQRKWIDNTKSEAKRMTDLVNDMLFLAKSDAAIEQSYNFMPINFSSVAEDCVLTFEAVAFEKGVKLVYEIKPDVVITADEAKMKQVIMILLDNALKYTDDNGIIAVSLQPMGRNIRFAVLNSGEPIPKNKQSHIFERFFRADESRARDKGGYGLGLSIAGNIMQAHKGKIALEFSDHRGTCFSLSLPLKQTGGKKRKNT